MADDVIATIRKTYPQDWPVYNKAQIEEKATIMDILADMLQEIEEPEQAMGRPRLTRRDLLFASTLKVYTQFSLRRFMSDLVFAKQEGFVEHAPCFAAVGHFMEREDITPILKRLIGISATPLRDMESVFAIDSSGFRTSRLSDYCEKKHNTKREHKWIKSHTICGVRTNIITDAVVAGQDSADCPQLIPLVQTTVDIGFRPEEVSADKAYSSRDNFEFIDSVGAVPYIPFRSNATGKARGSRMWKKAFHYFQLN